MKSKFEVIDLYVVGFLSIINWAIYYFLEKMIDITFYEIPDSKLKLAILWFVTIYLSVLFAPAVVRLLWGFCVPLTTTNFMGVMFLNLIAHLSMLMLGINTEQPHFIVIPIAQACIGLLALTLYSNFYKKKHDPN
jgi:hypothetical protein